ncbi:hypothetical protein JCM6882_005366 [Rhodosporidiobolus microsporus]
MPPPSRFPAPPLPYAPPSTSTSPLPPLPRPSSTAAAPPAQAPPPPPQPGTLPPGTVVNVGDYRVVVERFLSEGGFAHVYLATSSVPLPVGSPTATTKHVLKRMVVPDKRGVEEVGREVDVMRQLKNHPKIVNMIEASVADLPGGMDGSKGYEIYILMEWCPGGGIIDMMNTRLQNRLTESEILKIFSDVVEAVAHMHYQSPPLIHRDLKVENILLTPPNTYKLCDFGSTTRPLPREKVPTAVEGIQRVEMEINKTTTLQYRAPELVDVWGRKGFDEKIDIWALGVFLYKLCYYTTPFEEHGPLAILNAQYKFPPYPAYSPSIRSLVSSMLQERASNRPNIYQVHEMVCRLRGAPVRLENKYALQPSSTGQSSLPSRSPALSPSASVLSSTAAPPPSSNGAYLGADQIVPGRRGRPNKPTAPSVPAAAEPNRLVRTGLATVGSQGEKPAPAGGAGWESFGAAAGGALSSPGAGGGARGGFDSAPPLSAASTSNGFGDAFAPIGGDDAAPLKMEVELPSNAGMFAELLGPSSGGGAKGGRAPSPMNVLRAQQQQQRTVGAAGAAGDDDDRKRFEAAFPDLGELDTGLASVARHDADLAAAFSPPSSSTAGGAKPLPPAPATAQQQQQQSLIDAPSPPLAPVGEKMPSQLTGEDAPSSAAAAPGPPLPRRPPTSASQPERLPTPGAPSPSSSPAPAPAGSQAREGAFKPGLVSRGSQTSPHLLASWRNGSSGANGAAAADGKNGQGNGKGASGLRQSSVPELELEAPSPEEERKKPLDLLSGDDDEEDGFAPRSLVASPSSAASGLPSLTSPPPPSTSSLAGNVASKRMSFASPPPSSSSSSQPQQPQQQEREKFRPVTKRASWLPSSSASPSSSPLASPKPSLPPKPASPAPTPGAAAADEIAQAEQDGRTVEERFPALAIEEPTPPIPSGLGSSGGKRDEEKWEKVVEKEQDEGEDSSDDDEREAPAAARGVSKPDFDDEDFAPRQAPQQASTRPKFGGGFRPTPSQQQQPPLSTSPAPISLSSASASPAPSAATAGGGRGFSTSSTSSSSTGGGGGIDLGPALASIRKFAPPAAGTGNDAPPPPAKSLLDSQDDEDDTAFAPSATRSPPLVAPKPLPSGAASSLRRAPSTSSTSSSSNAKPGINSLLSRYEGIPLTGGPPPKGTKPAGLRKDSTGSSSSFSAGSTNYTGGGGTSAHGYQRDGVQPRALPQWAASAGGGRSPALPEKDEDPAKDKDEASVPSSPALPPKPSTPTFGAGGAGARAPFKPVPPPGSPSSASGSPSFGGNRTSLYGAPSSSSSSRPAFGGGSVKPAPSSAAEQAEQKDEEERFAGVSNMKSRWESMAKTQAPPGAGGAGKAGGKGRKEWAAI